jgi:hypothetical protein
MNCTDEQCHWPLEVVCLVTIEQDALVQPQQVALKQVRSLQRQEHLGFLQWQEAQRQLSAHSTLLSAMFLHKDTLSRAQHCTRWFTRMSSTGSSPPMSSRDTSTFSGKMTSCAMTYGGDAHGSACRMKPTAYRRMAERRQHLVYGCLLAVLCGHMAGRFISQAPLPHARVRGPAGGCGGRDVC